MTVAGHFSQINQEDVDACNLEDKDKGLCWFTVFGVQFSTTRRSVGNGLFWSRQKKWPAWGRPLRIADQEPSVG